MASRPGNDGAAHGSGDWVELGRLGGAYGLKGWVKVTSYTRPREGIFEYRRWYLDDGVQRSARDLASGRLHGGGLIARLEGCEDRDAAESLGGRGVWVPREALAENGPDEYYWRDLVGMMVENTAGEALGRVSELMETGANDVLVLDGDRERLVPFVAGVVREVDLQARRMVVDWERDF